MCNYERMVMRQQRAPNAGNFSEWQRGVCLTFHSPASVFIRASIKELIKCLCWIISFCPKENLNELGKFCWKFIDFISISSWIVWSFSVDFTVEVDILVWMYSHAPNGSHSIRFQSAHFRLFKTSHWLTFEYKHLISIYKMRQTISK